MSQIRNVLVDVDSFRYKLVLLTVDENLPVYIAVALSRASRSLVRYYVSLPAKIMGASLSTSVRCSFRPLDGKHELCSTDKCYFELYLQSAVPLCLVADTEPVRLQALHVSLDAFGIPFFERVMLCRQTIRTPPSGEAIPTANKRGPRASPYISGVSTVEICQTFDKRRNFSLL